MADFPPLDCSRVVYRTVFRKEWIRGDGSFKWQAFKPYLNDKEGVSTFMTPQDITEHSDKPYHGIISVKVGRVRNAATDNIKLNIVQDKDWHANITIPYPYDVNGDDDPDRWAEMIDHCKAIVGSDALRAYDEE